MLTRILAPHIYPASRADLARYTTRERYVRDVAYALKDAQPWAVEVAVEQMAALLPQVARVTLVPVPSSSGHAFANLVLATEIAWQANGPSSVRALVLDCLARTPQESSRVRRKRGEPGLSASEQVIRWLCSRPTGRVFLVDNVVTTGASALAAGRALRRDVEVLAWARAPNIGQRATLEAAARRTHSRGAQP